MIENELLDRLDIAIAERLRRGGLPGRVAQERFAPDGCYGRHFGFPPHDSRQAAVTILLYRAELGWSFPLTRRSATMTSHGGQICLPGGALDVGESEEEAALRELHEELGVDPHHVRMLGPLTSLNLFVSNHWVTPFVGVLDRLPQWIPNPAEVASIIETPVSTLINPERHQIKKRILGSDEDGGWSYYAPFFNINGQRVWGATAVILGEFIAIVDSIPSGDGIGPP